MRLAKISAVAFLLNATVYSYAAAQTVTAFKTGEALSGTTKQCFYNALGNSYTRTVSSVAICPLSIQVPSPASSSMVSPNTNQRSGGGTAFKSGENVTGMTKQCFYNYLGSTYTKTISSVAICPLSIRVGN